MVRDHPTKHWSAHTGAWWLCTQPERPFDAEAKVRWSCEDCRRVARVLVASGLYDPELKNPSPGSPRENFAEWVARREAQTQVA